MCDHSAGPVAETPRIAGRFVAPIRDGIQQVFQFLQRICDAHPKSDTQIQYAITFVESPNLDEFGKEIERLQLVHPELF